MDTSVATRDVNSGAATRPEKAGISLHGLVARINTEIAGARDFREKAEKNSPAVERQSLGRHICVELAGMMLAIPMDLVVEAGELEILQPLPLLAPWLPGVTNVRGNIITVVDLEKFLGAPEAAGRHLSRSFLIVDNSEMKVAVTVNRIVRTRMLYRLDERAAPAEATPFAVNSFFSARAVYEQDGREERITVFDLDVFLRSEQLHHPVAA